MKGEEASLEEGEGSLLEGEGGRGAGDEDARANTRGTRPGEVKGEEASLEEGEESLLGEGEGGASVKRVRV